MGCGSSKTPDSTTESGVLSGDVKPLPVNDDASTFQTVQSKNSSDRRSHAAPEGTTTIGTDLTTAEQRVSFAETKTATKSPQMTIVHFNDVYNIEPREKEPVGGAARFATKLASLRHLNPLVVFSGDCLNPSTSECRKHHPLCNFNKLISVAGQKNIKPAYSVLFSVQQSSLFESCRPRFIFNMAIEQIVERKMTNLV